MHRLPLWVIVELGTRRDGITTRKVNLRSCQAGTSVTPSGPAFSVRMYRPFFACRYRAKQGEGDGGGVGRGEVVSWNRYQTLQFSISDDRRLFPCGHIAMKSPGNESTWTGRRSNKEWVNELSVLVSSFSPPRCFSSTAKAAILLAAVLP